MTIRRISSGGVYESRVGCSHRYRIEVEVTALKPDDVVARPGNGEG